MQYKVSHAVENECFFTVNEHFSKHLILLFSQKSCTDAANQNGEKKVSCPMKQTYAGQVLTEKSTLSQFAVTIFFQQASLILKDDVVMKDLEVDGENEKNEESATPVDVNVCFKIVYDNSTQILCGVSMSLCIVIFQLILQGILGVQQSCINGS